MNTIINLESLILTPLIGILSVFFGSRKQSEHTPFNISIFFAIISFVISILIALNFDFENQSKLQFQKDKFECFIEYFVGRFHLYSVGIDGLSLLLVLLNNFLILLCLISAKTSIKTNSKLFCILFLLLQFFCVGLFVSKSIIWFYIFFEAILIPMFFIIGIWGGKQKIYASYKFFIYTFAGSVCFLIGLVYVILASKSIDIFEIPYVIRGALPEKAEKLLWLAFFISFAIKVPMFPFHTWLPDAHVQAPTSGSVLLAGILIKIGGLGMIRFLLPMFPNASIYFSNFVIWLSIIGILYGSFIAIMQEDIKKMIAYSSIAHMGFVTAAIFSLNQNGLSAAIFQMVSHGIVSGALFLCIGVLYDRFHTREFKNFGGLAKKMPKFAILLMIFTMSSAGLPGTSGFIGEFLTILSVYNKDILYSFLACLSVIFGALYMLYMYKKTMLGTMSKNLEVVSDITKTEFFNLSVLAFITVLCGIYPKIIFNFIPILF